MNPDTAADKHAPLIQNPLGWTLFSMLILATPVWKLIEDAENRVENPISSSGITSIEHQNGGVATAPPIFNEPASLPLVNHLGQPVTLDTLNGSIAVVSFLFTRCPDICPALALRFLELEEQVPNTIGNVPIHFITITVDPKFDRPEVLSDYKEKFADAPERWHLWTGEIDQIDSTVREFQLALDRFEGSDGPVIAHSERFVVLDPQGRIRNFYPSNDLGLDSLIEDLPILASGS